MKRICIGFALLALAGLAGYTFTVDHNLMSLIACFTQFGVGMAFLLKGYLTL